jgi:isopentenyl diphosphate isomerase/L-lactate dehydrogenase-like FMN-dependent dehydrogenase
MTARDAKRAVEAGVDIVWVSNHGGRQLDHTQGSIDALPPIVDAVAGAAAIVVDGGFTRGTAVLKGLALGATVVAVGRTVLWGLAADGAAGVACALDILRRELARPWPSGQTSVKNLARPGLPRRLTGRLRSSADEPSTGIRRFRDRITAGRVRATAPRSADRRAR